jgi:hypothetical protein
MMRLPLGSCGVTLFPPGMPALPEQQGVQINHHLRNIV